MDSGDRACDARTAPRGERRPPRSRRRDRHRGAGGPSRRDQVDVGVHESRRLCPDVSPASAARARGRRGVAGALVHPEPGRLPRGILRPSARRIRRRIGLESGAARPGGRPVHRIARRRRAGGATIRRAGAPSSRATNARSSSRRFAPPRRASTGARMPSSPPTRAERSCTGTRPRPRSTAGDRPKCSVGTCSTSCRRRRR